MENMTNRRLTIGVIGGMGPAATLDLFSKILALTPAGCDEEHLNIQIDNNPLPGANREPLCTRAKKLEANGVDFIVIPCNAAHEFYVDVQSSVGIPVVNMIRETVRSTLKLNPGIQKVAVLAWYKTLKAEIYQNALSEFGIQSVVPDPKEWQVLIDLINAVKSGGGSEKKPAAILLGERLIAAGAQAIILGCTELPLVLSQDDFSVPVIDATSVLASTAVDLALGRTSFVELNLLKTSQNVQGGNREHNNSAHQL